MDPKEIFEQVVDKFGKKIIYFLSKRNHISLTIQ